MRYLSQSWNSRFQIGLTMPTMSRLLFWCFDVCVVVAFSDQFSIFRFQFPDWPRLWQASNQISDFRLTWQWSPCHQIIDYRFQRPYLRSSSFQIPDSKLSMAITVWGHQDFWFQISKTMWYLSQSWNSIFQISDLLRPTLTWMGKWNSRFHIPDSRFQERK